MPLETSFSQPPSHQFDAGSLDSLLSAIADQFQRGDDSKVSDWTMKSSGDLTSLRYTGQDDLLQSRIMIVDDEPLNVRLAQKFIMACGYSQFVTSTDSRNAIELLRDEKPDILLLDVMMPHVSGLDLLQEIRSDDSLPQIPIIMLTASASRETKLQALEYGATDFLPKPVDSAELAPRLRNALLMQSYQNRLRNHASELESMVKQRTYELCQSRLDLVRCLATAAEFRDDDTGRHVVRVGRYAGVIARALGKPDAYVEMIEIAAQLHDVGKIGIPDSVLLKPGRLNDEEREIMKGHAQLGQGVLEPMMNLRRDAHEDEEDERVVRHTEIGARILSTSRCPLTAMASSIALTHHEKWDGSGYPLGLSREQIPLEGRITAIADVFDALRAKRPYKDSFPVDRCFEIMEEERGRHFDPQVLDCFLTHRDEITALDAKLADA